MMTRLLKLALYLFFSTIAVAAYAAEEQTTPPADQQAAPIASPAPTAPEKPAAPKPAPDADKTATPGTVSKPAAPITTPPSQPVTPIPGKQTPAPANTTANTPVTATPQTASPAIPSAATPPPLVKPLASPPIPAKQAAPATTPSATTTPVKPQTGTQTTPDTATPSKPVTAVKPAVTIPAPVTFPAQNIQAKPAPIPAKPAAPVAIKPAPPATPIAKPPVSQSAATDSSSSGDILSQTADIEVFVREGCPNCDSAKEFLNKLQEIQPQLKINIRDIRKEPAAMELLKRISQSQGVEILDYPAFVVSGQLFIGFSDEANTIQLILDNLPLTHSTSDGCEDSKTPGCGLIPIQPPAKPENITFDVFGYTIALAQIGLPLFTLAMGLLDGINFGSTWVLMLMLSLLAPLNDRSRMFTIAGTFLSVQAVLYLLLMTAWFNLVALVPVTQATQTIFALIAIVAAIIYFKNYLYFGQRLLLSTHEIDKPGIYTYIRKIIETETFVATVAATVALSIFIVFTEFSYKSVFPMLYTKVLAMQHLNTLSNFAYLMLYDFAYMLDDLIILIIGIISLKQERAPEHESNLPKVISSLILLATAIYLFKFR